MSSDNITKGTATTTDATAILNSTSSPLEAGNHIQKLALAGLLSVVIVIVIVGNTLVILAVLTTRRLRTVTNCFVMSLAVADWLVGIFVMPPAVAYNLMGVWELGWVLCDIWISLDILLCTASILSLCAISVDRYLAVTQPLSYSRKRRSKRLAFTMILIVWVSSALITCPPMFGWYEPGRHENKVCRYNRNTGYVIFSASGSFFIPMIVMLYVYVKISCVIAKRHDQLAHLDTISTRKSQKLVLHHKEESDIDRGSSECEEQHLRFSRYIQHIDACGHSPEPLNQNNHTTSSSNDHQQQQQQSLQLNSTGSSSQKPASVGHSRSLRSNLNYSFNHDPLTPQRSASLYRSSLPIRNTRPESLNLDASILNFEPATRVSSFRRESKTARTLSIVMGGFIACWLPFFVDYILTPFINSNDANDNNDLNSLIMSYLTWLGWINSAINPFIYAFYSPDFRIAFWRLTVKHFAKNNRR